MLDLSPEKLLVVFIVVIILLGPQRLPQVARQLGAGWRRLKEFTEQVDRDVRQSIPDLPSTRDIARYARSPASLLDELARVRPEGEELIEDPAAGAGAETDGADWPTDPGAAAQPTTTAPPARAPLVVPDDPSMN